MMRNVISAVCIQCGEEYEAVPTITTCSKCGGILDIKYDYEYIKTQITKEILNAGVDNSMWRYKEFLPITGESKVP
ncbi:MAG: threonine synthase, partial [Lachnospiraceae bacterium]|nr:threonine synthase [Lachnospiraceae bacterium]